jgi:tripartite ATP-independent transporter DctM subunit
VTSFAVGIGGFVVMFLLIMARMPVALAMLAVGSAGYIYFVGVSSFLNFLNATPYYLFANYTLSVIPLFVLMGAFAERSGLARDLFALCSVLVGRVHGGLAISVIGACSIFGAICGSSLATTATFSRAALPEMRRLGYDPAFGAAIIAVGGVVDLLIPPSIVLVIYAILAEQNIAKLFQAALVPGLLGVVLYCLVIRIVASRNPRLAPIQETLAAEGRGPSLLLSVWPALLVIVVVLGGIYSGIFTATEAAGAGAVLMLLAGLMQRRLSWPDFADSLAQTASTSAMIFAVLLGAEVFNAFLALTQMPEAAAQWIAGLSISPYAVMAIVMVFYILLGGVMDELAMMLLTIPVFFPILNALDFGIPKDEVGIWFGILVLTVVGIGLIAPPIGLGVFIVTSITGDVSIVQVYRRILPFIAADCIRLALLIAFPVVTLFLVRAFS